ncbi:phage tail sheath C-terminal domain-containing protein [Rhizobium sp. WYCCWR 11128]|uniref:phage tail sheath family protein n=1 Tax=Rhizobium sp. WYCCWR 11128 TaxID=2749832 RepID=UPI0015D38982|nr:phage tail sheath C-terminal domain-containing protein [Rhizobium sp. WYCCWR 11128]NYT32037.1 phage tail sheath family protein [Rhizobium sp. WYCCWR 11128]
MLQLKFPGVYTQELASGVRSIAGAPTSVALFVGPTKAGIDGRPIRLQNFGDFERNFGGLSQTSSLSYSVLHFFTNGGGEAYVLRVPASGATAASSGFRRDAGGATLSLTLAALSSGKASEEIFVEFDSFGLGANPDKKLFNLTISDRLTGRVERFSNLSTSSASARFAPTVVNDAATGSKLVAMDLTGTAIDKQAPQPTGSIYAIGTAPAAGTFASAQNVKVNIEFRDANGAIDASAAISIDVVAFEEKAAKPKTPLELCIRLTAALNAAIRANATAAGKLETLSIEGGIFEGGTLMRLRIAPVGTTVTPSRRVDGTVTLAAPASGTSLFTTYSLAEKVANPSRFQLGRAYASSQISGALIPGDDGDASGQPVSSNFKDVVTALIEPDPFFNILCLPDAVRPSAKDPLVAQHEIYPLIYSEAAFVCSKKFAFLIMDPPPNVQDVGGAEAWKTTGISFQSKHSAAYFPNIRVDDPLEPGAIRSHPPSGAIAGLFARTDSATGVWQAPAGTECVLSGAYGPSVVLSDEQQGILNPLGLNVIRKFPVYGTVSFGSRTIDGADAMNSEWKYIPVRRTASYILRSLSEGLRWAVHKPNGEQLWSQLRVNVTAFMQGLFRQGAFKGVSSREAYFVACDSSTTTADDINAGVVNIVIGFAPLRPAEFVVISLRQIIQSGQ